MPEHSQRLRRQGVKSHIGQSDARRAHRAGIPVSTPEQTFIDLAAAGVKLVDLVVIGDAMLKAKLTTIPTLMEAVEEWDGYGTLAFRAAGRMRQGVDSPMETRVRLLIVLAGLPEPSVNLIVRRRRQLADALRPLLHQSTTHRRVRRASAQRQPSAVGA